METEVFFKKITKGRKSSEDKFLIFSDLKTKIHKTVIYCVRGNTVRNSLAQALLNVII